ncbi:MAG: SHOCT domain-containing protein [Mycobacterium sp.]|nr:SHOCT domain-containing protein [Mycobacterium sp.]
MTDRRQKVSGLLLVFAVLSIVVGLAGLIVSIILNVFVLDKYDAYGEVPIPGTRSLHLPAGEATITFHTYTVGSTGGGGLPIPQLGLTIVPPSGVADPVVTENFGSTTSVNNDVRRRVWVVDIPVDGTYQITTEGNVSAFLEPRLAFGHSSSYGWVTWAFVAVLVNGVVDLVVALVMRSRARKSPQVALAADQWNTGAPWTATPPAPISTRPVDPYTPTDDGVRIEQLKTLAALRDSGALTAAEFEAEKRRVLDGN